VECHSDLPFSIVRTCHEFRSCFSLSEQQSRVGPLSSRARSMKKRRERAVPHARPHSIDRILDSFLSSGSFLEGLDKPAIEEKLHPAKPPNSNSFFDQFEELIQWKGISHVRHFKPATAGLINSIAHVIKIRTSM
jgi:hypothetical protein